MKKIISILALGTLIFALGISSASAAVPDAVTTLICSKGSMAGSVNIYWTVPAGTTGGYEVKYYADPINSANYSSATTYAQSFDSGTAGAVSEHLLVGLNAGSQYNFAVKAINADGLSAVSNSAGCKAGTFTAADSEAPTSYITSPAANATVSVGVPLTIKGTAKDNGSSSIQKTEVSMNGGVNWASATPIANDGGNIIWEFIWIQPSAGAQTIMVRSTDWAGNAETPILQNINVVSGIVSPTPSPAITPAPTPAPSVSPTPSLTPVPKLSNINDGDLVRVAGGTKVYAVKGNYRRWIQSAEIFKFYPHFSFSAVKEITLEQLQSYVQSWLIRADGDTKVYEINGDGTKHWINISAQKFSDSGRLWDMVYIVNARERNFYKTGATVTK